MAEPETVAKCVGCMRDRILCSNGFCGGCCDCNSQESQLVASLRAQLSAALADRDAMRGRAEAVCKLATRAADYLETASEIIMAEADGIEEDDDDARELIADLRAAIDAAEK